MGDFEGEVCSKCGERVIMIIKDNGFLCPCCGNMVYFEPYEE